MIHLGEEMVIVAFEIIINVVFGIVIAVVIVVIVNCVGPTFSVTHSVASGFLIRLLVPALSSTNNSSVSLLLSGVDNLSKRSCERLTFFRNIFWQEIKSVGLIKSCWNNLD